MHAVAQEVVAFDVRGTIYKRPRCEANALGKSLMIARSMLLAGIEAAPGIELREAFALVTKHLRLLALPFDWQAAERHLAGAL